MSFTYTGDLTIDRDWVRFEVGDTTEGSAWLTDEVIASLLAVKTTKQLAVISALKYIITQLARPDFKADWLSVTNGEARKGYQTMLADKLDEYGLSPSRGLSAGVVNTYRPDSFMTDPN